MRRVFGSWLVSERRHSSRVVEGSGRPRGASKRVAAGIAVLPHREGSAKVGPEVEVEDEAETEVAGVGSRLGGTWQKEYMISLFAGSIS
jgi:hypothetical protein